MYLLEKDFNNVLTTILKRLQKLKQETAVNETRMAEKSRWYQANRRQKTCIVWKNRSLIIKDYLYLPFFLLIILWSNHGETADWYCKEKGMISRILQILRSFKIYIIGAATKLWLLKRVRQKRNLMILFHNGSTIKDESNQNVMFLSCSE
jgi:hypothetical protein